MNQFTVTQRGHIQYKSIIDAWTPEEDRELCKNYHLFNGDFSKLMQLLPNRQVHEVRARWQKFELIQPINDRDDMKQNRGEWNMLDEIKFFEGLYLYGSDFESISKISLGKSQEEIHQRYIQYQYQMKANNLKQWANKWNENDDVLLLVLHQYVAPNFEKIVQKFPEKNPKLVNDRYQQLSQRLNEKQAHDHIKKRDKLLNKLLQLCNQIEKIPLKNQIPPMTLEFNPKVRNRRIVSNYKLFQQIDESQWQLKENQNSQERQQAIELEFKEEYNILSLNHQRQQQNVFQQNVQSNNNQLNNAQSNTQSNATDPISVVYNKISRCKNTDMLEELRRIEKIISAHIIK